MYAKAQEVTFEEKKTYRRMALKLGITSSSVNGPCFSMKTVFRTDKYKDSQYKRVVRPYLYDGISYSAW